MHIKIWTLGLLAIMVVSACVPATAPAPALPAATKSQSQGVESAPSVITPAPAASEPTAAVTPRGNALEATEPSTVNLASGRPQLVEFFRFT